MSREHGYFPPGSMLRRVQQERAVGLLYPPRVRELYGLRWTSADAFAFRSAVAAARAARPITPRSVRRGSCVAQFDDVAAAERKRIANGWTSPVDVPRAVRACPHSIGSRPCASSRSQTSIAT